MDHLAFVLAAWLFVVGLFGIVWSRNFVHAIMCVAVFQSSSYVLLMEIGYRSGGTAPIFYDVPQHGTKIVDPVMKALTLTDVVVSVTVTGVLLALAVRAQIRGKTVAPDELRPMEG